MNHFNLRERDLEVLRRTFARFPWVLEVCVFGSRATGNARRASDIDLGITAPHATAGQWTELNAALEEAPVIFELDIFARDQSKTLPCFARLHVTA